MADRCGIECDDALLKRFMEIVLQAGLQHLKVLGVRIVIALVHS
jgi:hypothetical protein